MNNKGFAVSTMLYGLSIMGIMLVALLMSLMSNNRVNTKEIVEAIEKDLNEYSATEAKYDSGTGIFQIPSGKSGWYKFEIWGTNYVAGVVWLKEGKAVSYDVNNTVLKVDGAVLLNMNGYGTIGSEIEKDKCYNLSGATNTTMQIQNGNIIRNINASKKIAIHILTPAETNSPCFTYPNYSQENFSATYYFMAMASDTNPEKSNLAMTMKTSAGEGFTKGDIVFEKFTGAANQKWTIKRIKGTSEYNIVNEGNGMALESATESINDSDEVGDLVAKQPLDYNSRYMRWSMAVSPNAGYEGSYVFRAMNFNTLYPGNGFLKMNVKNGTTDKYIATFSKTVEGYKNRFSLQNAN